MAGAAPGGAARGATASRAVSTSAGPSASAAYPLCTSRFVPSKSENTGAGAANTSRFCSRAMAAVRSAPPVARASATSTAALMPETIRLRRGKCGASGPAPIGSSETTAPRSRARISRTTGAWRAGYTRSTPEPRTATVRPPAASAARWAADVDAVGEPADHGRPAPGEPARERPGHADAVVARLPGPDHGDGPVVGLVQPAEHPEERGRVVDLAEPRRVLGVAEGHEPGAHPPRPLELVVDGPVVGARADGLRRPPPHAVHADEPAGRGGERGPGRPERGDERPRPPRPHAGHERERHERPPLGVVGRGGGRRGRGGVEEQVGHARTYGRGGDRPGRGGDRSGSAPPRWGGSGSRGRGGPYLKRLTPPHPAPMRLVTLAGLLALAGPAFAQSAYTITGRVVDAALEDGIPGASVLLDGTQSGAATDAEGRFSFDARVEAGTYTLRTSFVGYRTVTTELTLGADRVLDVGLIELADDALRSGEVLVSATGIGTERRQLGNAVGSIDAREIADAGATSVDQAIVGKVAGAVVSQNSGNPAGGISIRLRGPSTVLGSADPLYVIDGVIVDNSSASLYDLGGGSQNRLVDLNPEDIERIEILKGASAAALYGSRANGGVVQIFTKRGTSGVPKVTLSTSVRTDGVRKTLDVNRAAFDRPQGTAPEASATPNAVERFDYQEDIFQQAVGTEQYLSVSGGREGGTYFFSGGHFFNEGIVQGNQFRRLNGRVRVGQDFGDVLNLSVGANYTRSRSEDVPNGGLASNYGALTGFIFGPNTVDIQPDPVTGEFPDLVLQNPLDVINNFDFNQTTNRFTGDAQARLTPAEGLSISYVLGLDTYTQSGLAFVPRGSTAGGFDGGFSRRADFNVTNLNNDLRLQYRTEIGEAVESTTTLGGTSQYDQNSTFAIQTFDLNVGVETVDGGSRPSAVGESRAESTLLGAFVQQTFGIVDQLFVTAAGRVDASSRFGPDNRTNFYPKFSASYDAGSNAGYARIAENGFLPSTLRLRASYGESGGLTSIGPFTRFTRYAPGAYGGANGVLAPGLLGNPEVLPERQKEFEVGTDLGFFGGRLGLEATYYTQNTEDLLLNVELPLTSGFSNQLRNVGELSNTGVELLARALPVVTDGFRWSSTATFATNKNRIDLDPNRDYDPALDDPTRSDDDPETLILGNSFGLVAVIDDQPQGVFYGSGFARDDAGNIVGLAVDPSTNQIVVNADGTPTFATGTLNDDGILVDASGAILVPVRDGRSRIIGDPNPDFTASWINEFEVGRRFSARVQLDGAFGGDVFNFTRRLAALRFFGTLSDYQAEIEGDVPVGYYQNSGVPGPDPRNYGVFSIFENWIEDGTFVKLREVSLSYTVPVELVRGFGVQGLQVTAYGRNLLSFDSYSGYDPETNVAGQSTGVRGYDFVEVPIPRTFGVTLRANL